MGLRPARALGAKGRARGLGVEGSSEVAGTGAGWDPGLPEVLEG